MNLAEKEKRKNDLPSYGEEKIVDCEVGECEKSKEENNTIWTNVLELNEEF